ncbi:hypothetical protein, partial [Gemmiger sp.]|uniref:hypothetical protein n=1 Tax=Gemmiger sp. TaxID=2049027 RepID=UPI002E775E85
NLGGRASPFLGGHCNSNVYTSWCRPPSLLFLGKKNKRGRSFSTSFALILISRHKLVKKRS